MNKVYDLIAVGLGPFLSPLFFFRVRVSVALSWRVAAGSNCVGHGGGFRGSCT